MVETTHTTHTNRRPVSDPNSIDDCELRNPMQRMFHRHTDDVLNIVGCFEPTKSVDS